MKKALLILLCLAALGQISPPLNSVHATKTLNIEQGLVGRGYELSEAGMGEVLTNRDESAMLDCLLYIEQEQFVNLLSEVESYLDFVKEKGYANEGDQLMIVRCVFALDKNMDMETLDGYLKRIRRLLYDVKSGDDDFRGAPIHAYNALLATQKYQAVDIYEDLLYLSATDIMKGGDYPFDTKKLFELYGDRVSENDLDTMLDAWQDWPERQTFILRRAREHGLRLEPIE